MATTHDPLATPIGTGATGMREESTGATGMREESKTEDMKNRLSGATTQVREKASEFGRTAREKIDQNFHNAAGAFKSAASAIRSRMPQGQGRMSGMASTTADKLDSTARYMREHNAGDLLREVENWARRNPGAAIGTAAGVGLLLGMTMKRDRRYR